MKNNNIDFDINKAITLTKSEYIIELYQGFVTNYRFLYFAVSKDKQSNSIAVTQWDINGIGGIKSEIGKRVSTIQSIIATFTLLLSFTGFIYMFINYFANNLAISKQLWLLIPSGIIFILAIFLFIFSKRRMFSLEVMTKSSFTSLVSLEHVTWLIRRFLKNLVKQF